MASPDLQIDPRGPRFGAIAPLTGSIVALILGPSLASSIIFAVLVGLFIPGAITGPQATLQGLAFRKFIRPRIGTPKETESFRPPRFAQQVGLFFSVAGLVFSLTGLTVPFFVFVGFLLVAAFLQSVVGFCLGCEIYLLFKRFTTKVA